MALELPAGFKSVATVAYTKADGTPGQVEGLPVWEVSDPTLLTVTPAADGLSADLVWAGTGQVTLTIRADGDLGTGVFPIVLSDTITLLPPLGATAGSLSFAAPTPV